MTHNQINYWNYRETGRHNVATENETNRHNVVTEGETKRHNLATEGIDLSKLNETTRHNLATEQEMGRHNLESESQGRVKLSIDSGTLGEITRHNQATESLTGTDLNIKSGNLNESIRHNTTTENISQQQVDSQRELNTANALLADTKRTWESLKGSSYLNLTEAQIKQIDNDINRATAQIGLIQAQTKGQSIDNVYKGLDQATKLIHELSYAVDALIPG